MEMLQRGAGDGESHCRFFPSSNHHQIAVITACDHNLSQMPSILQLICSRTSVNVLRSRSLQFNDRQ